MTDRYKAPDFIDIEEKDLNTIWHAARIYVELKAKKDMETI